MFMFCFFKDHLEQQRNLTVYNSLVYYPLPPPSFLSVTDSGVGSSSVPLSSSNANEKQTEVVFIQPQLFECYGGEKSFVRLQSGDAEEFKPQPVSFSFSLLLSVILLHRKWHI
jgi:hypothetical protein